MSRGSCGCRIAACDCRQGQQSGCCYELRVVQRLQRLQKLVFHRAHLHCDAPLPLHLELIQILRLAPGSYGPRCLQAGPTAWRHSSLARRCMSSAVASAHCCKASGLASVPPPTPWAHCCTGLQRPQASTHLQHPPAASTHLQQPVCQRALAVVDVGDYGEVSDAGRREVGHRVAAAHKAASRINCRVNRGWCWRCWPCFKGDQQPFYKRVRTQVAARDGMQEASTLGLRWSRQQQAAAAAAVGTASRPLRSLDH